MTREGFHIEVLRLLKIMLVKIFCNIYGGLNNNALTLKQIETFLFLRNNIFTYL